MSKIFKAREIVIPADMAETLDKRVGKPKGTLMGKLADEGKLREKDTFLLALGLIPHIRDILQSTEVKTGDKELSMGRFSSVIWSIMFAYCIGTLKVEKGGDVVIGSSEDVGFAGEILLADKIKFRNGKVMDKKLFMHELNDISDEDQLDVVYSRTVRRNKLTLKKEISPVDMHRVIMTSLMVANDLMDGKI